jgi:hypothetical protein
MRALVVVAAAVGATLATAPGAAQQNFDTVQVRSTHVAVRDRIRGLIRGGKTLAQVQAAKPTAQFDARWGAGSITPERFVEIVYTDLAARK